MGKILSDFSRVLPQVQAREIENELRSPEARVLLGENLAEVRLEIQRRLREALESDTGLRFFPLTLEEDDYRDSETINWMVERISGDLTALFAEADHLVRSQTLANDLFREKVLFRIEQALNELENELDRTEILSGRFNGLSDGVAENFRSDGQRLDQTEPRAHLALVDPKTNNPLVAEQEMPINLALGGLTLPVTTLSRARPSRIQDVANSDVFDAGDAHSLPGGATPSTTGEVQEIGGIFNAIDRSERTVWTKKIKTKIVEGGARLNLVLHFTPGPILANYIQIVPGSNHRYEILAINYVKETNEVESLDLPGGGVIFSGKVLLPFPAVKVKQVGIVLVQKEYTRVAFGRNELVEYAFSIKDISVGLSQFRPLGYYVTKTLELPRISRLYLSAEENGTLLSFSEGDASIPTIEYWVAYRELDEASNVLVSSYIPILPVEKAQSKERLHLNERDRATLMFKIDEALADDDASLRVFRDGVELVRPLDYRIEDSGDSFAKGTVLEIQNGFSIESEYIAIYDPLHLDSEKIPFPFTDETGSVEYLLDGSVKIARPENSRAVKSEANLIVLMRGGGDDKRTVCLDRLIFGVG